MFYCENLNCFSFWRILMTKFSTILLYVDMGIKGHAKYCLHLGVPTQMKIIFVICKILQICKIFLSSLQIKPMLKRSLRPLSTMQNGIGGGRTWLLQYIYMPYASFTLLWACVEIHVCIHLIKWRLFTCFVSTTISRECLKKLRQWPAKINGIVFYIRIGRTKTFLLFITAKLLHV